MQKTYDKNTPRLLLDMMVHNRPNFTEGHFAVNVYQLQTFDMLHQLMVKGLLNYLLDWLRECVGEGRTKLEAQALIDARFRAVPKFTKLRRFREFSKLSQWTGEESKEMLRIIIPVFAPLLSEKNPDILHAGRAIVDFIMLARYRSHDEATLEYMNAALERIDLLKEVFRKYRPVNKKTGEQTFNFPKFHSISHYIDMIRYYGPPDGYSTQASERAHPTLLKNYYDRTNKHEDYQEQLMEHNERHVKLTIMRDIKNFQETEPVSLSRKRKQEDEKSTKAGVLLDLHQLGWRADAEERYMLRHLYKCDSRYWRTARDVAEWLNIAGFLQSLAAFLKAHRAKTPSRGSTTSNPDIDRREADCSWVESYPVCVHSGLVCWKTTGEDSSDLGRLYKDLVVCRPHKHSQYFTWRRDCVWVREQDCKSRNPETTQEGKLVGKVLVVVEVKDLGNRDFKQRPTRVQAALVEVFDYRYLGQVQDCHGMVEVEKARASLALNPRTIGARRFYGLPNIERSAHLVPGTVRGKEIFYINSFIDWDQYTTVYHPKFLTNNSKAARRIHAKFLPNPSKATPQTQVQPRKRKRDNTMNVSGSIERKKRCH